MTNPIYCESDDKGHIPILITKHRKGILVEIRAYYNNKQSGAIWNTMTWEQVRRLRDNLSNWLIENPKEGE